MAPPAGISPLAAGLRSAGGMLLSGALLLGALAFFSFDTERDHHARRAPSLFAMSRPYVLVLLLGIAALCYLGTLRAAITHQERKRLALQTCAIALVCAGLARLAGCSLVPTLALPLA